MFGKKVISFLAAGMMLISLASCGCSDSSDDKSSGSNGSMEAPIASYIDAMNNADADKQISAYPDEVAKAFDRDEDAYDELQENLESIKEVREGKITYKITDKEAFDEDDLSDLESKVNSALENIADAADIVHKDITITEAYSVSVEYSWGDEESDTMFNVFKSDGKWYLYEGLSSMPYYF